MSTKEATKTQKELQENNQQLIRTLGRCIEKGHLFRYKSNIECIVSPRGDNYCNIIEECCRCGYKRDRPATRKEIKAIRILGLIIGLKK